MQSEFVIERGMLKQGQVRGHCSMEQRGGGVAIHARSTKAVPKHVELLGQRTNATYCISICHIVISEEIGNGH